MGELKQEEVKQVAQSHTASIWLSWNLNPGHWFWESDHLHHYHFQTPKLLSFPSMLFFIHGTTLNTVFIVPLNHSHEIFFHHSHHAI